MHGYMCSKPNSTIGQQLVIPYEQKFLQYVNFKDFAVTYRYSENLIHENLLV